MLDPKKLTEAEVSLRLAICFAEHSDISGNSSVAIGQLMTVDEVGDNDILEIAVPNAPKFDNRPEVARGSPD